MFDVSKTVAILGISDHNIGIYSGPAVLLQGARAKSGDYGKRQGFEGHPVEI